MQNNPYAKTTGDTCYLCNGNGYRLKMFLTRRVVVVADEREEEEERVGHAVENDEYERLSLQRKNLMRVNFLL